MKHMSRNTRINQKAVSHLYQYLLDWGVNKRPPKIHHTYMHYINLAKVKKYQGSKNVKLQSVFFYIYLDGHDMSAYV